MKKLLLASMIFVSIPAFAGEGEGNGYGHGRNRNNNENVNINVNENDSYSSSYSEGSRAISHSEGGDAAAGGGSAFNSLNVNHEAPPANTKQEIEHRGRIHNTPEVNAPALATGGNDICMGSTSAGIAGPGFGVSAGSTWVDEDCERRKNAAILFNMGHAATAKMLLCSNEKIAAAFNASGEFACPAAPAKTADAGNNDLYR